jgi:hypothetical protein
MKYLGKTQFNENNGYITKIGEEGMLMHFSKNL